MTVGPTLQTSKDHRGVLSVTLDRPAFRNALDQQLLLELDSVFQNEVLQPDVRVVILRGKGPVFCAGADLSEMKSALYLSPDENQQAAEKLFQLFLRMNSCPKPLIGVVQGAVIGGGLGLVSVCDSVIAVKRTEFCLSEARLGLVPACISPFLIAKIGVSHARRLCLSAIRWNTADAKEMGLIHEVVAEDDLLDLSVERHVKDFLSCGPYALAVTKKLFLDLTWPQPGSPLVGEFRSVSQVLAQVRVGDEAQEGIRAFLEKRKPSWSIS